MKKAERDALYQKHRSISELAAVTANNADIVLMRVLVTDPLTSRQGQVRPHGASGACVGVLEAKGQAEKVAGRVSRTLSMCSCAAAPIWRESPPGLAIRTDP